MFVISYKKAEDLANAMEARGYIPGKERSKIDVLHFKVSDTLTFIFLVVFIALIVVGKIFKVV